MLDQLDDALKGLLERRGVSATIVFDTPDADWGARVSQPTLNLFLWDIRRSLDQSEGRDLVGTTSGDRVWRRQRPRIEFHYLVTAWTTVVADEHRLLGDALVAILGSDALTGVDRPAFVSDDDPPPMLRVARADGKDLADFWGAVDGKLKPGLNVVVSMSVDPGLAVPAGAPTTNVELRTGFLHGGRVHDPDSVSSVGWEHESVGAVVTATRGPDTPATGSTGSSEQVGDASRVGVAHVVRHAGRRPRGNADGTTTYLVRGAPGDLITITSPDGTVEQYTFPPPDDRPTVEEQETGT